MEHVKNEELFPEVVRVLPPVYRQVEAAIVDIARSEEVADHGEWSVTLPRLSDRSFCPVPGTGSLQCCPEFGMGSPVLAAPSGPVCVAVGLLLKTLHC